MDPDFKFSMKKNTKRQLGGLLAALFLGVLVFAVKPAVSFAASACDGIADPVLCMQTSGCGWTGICAPVITTQPANGGGSGSNCTNIIDPITCASTSGCTYTGDACAAGGTGGTLPVGCATSNLTGASCCARYPYDQVCTAYQNSGGATLNPTVPSTVSGSCGDSRLTMVNGFCVPANTYAAGSPAGAGTLVDLIFTVIKYLLILSGLIAVVALIIGGFWYITAAGNEEQSEKGRKALTSSIIGLIIIIMAYAIVTIITSTLTTPDILKRSSTTQTTNP